jgi:Mg-chelatase subunit ChlD
MSTNSNSSNSGDIDLCLICLCPAKTRGGEFLSIPGCCGKAFHQGCLAELIRNGKPFCPACRVPFVGQQLAPVISPRPIPLLPRTNRLPSMANLVEDPVTVSIAESRDQNNSNAEFFLNALSVEVTPEFPEISFQGIPSFHAKVSLSLKEEIADNSQQSAMNEGRFTSKTALDLICVLDNSGSMEGSKIEHLKTAVEFIIESLSENDRLSVISFNSATQVVHGLWKMTPDRKATALEMVRNIRAGGGTKIFEGIAAGQRLLRERQTHNPSSCVFLLTDGQDSTQLMEKRNLARELQNGGTSVFVFGFGADHDSAQLTDISRAAGGSFVYVETDEMVIDALGGAIGHQQESRRVRDIQLNVSLLSSVCSIERILAGDYQSFISPERKTGTITVPDLVAGEKRNFLLQLSIPLATVAVIEDISNNSESTNNNNNYNNMKNTDQQQQDDVGSNSSFPLFVVHTSYCVPSSSSSSSSLVSPRGPRRITSSPSIECVIRRSIAPVSPVERNIEIEAHLFRFDCSQVLKQVMELADRNQFVVANEVLSRFKEKLTSSPSFQRNHPMVLVLLQEINQCESKIVTRESYHESGMRSHLMETTTTFSTERTVLQKHENSPMTFQSPSASIRQRTFSESFRSRTISMSLESVTGLPLLPPIIHNNNHNNNNNNNSSSSSHIVNSSRRTSMRLFSAPIDHLSDEMKITY